MGGRSSKVHFFIFFFFQVCWQVCSDLSMQKFENYIFFLGLIIGIEVEVGDSIFEITVSIRQFSLNFKNVVPNLASFCGFLSVFFF